MATPLLNLPGYNPGNSLLNFEPIQQALQQKIRTDQMEMENQFRQRRADIEDKRYEDQEERQKAEAFGNKALAFSNLPPEQRDPAAWQRILSGVPGTIPDAYKDPVRGPQMVAAEFGKFRETRDKDNVRVVGDALVRFDGNRAVPIYQRPDPIGDALRNKMQGGAPASAPSPAPVAPGYQPIPQGGPRLQQQGAVGNEVMPGGVTPVSDTTAPRVQPPAAAAQQMIDTPFGRMSRDEAQALVGPMLLDPRYQTAGKALQESLGSPNNPAGLQNPTRNAIEEKQLNTTESLARLSNIAKQFKPEFQTIESRLGYAWTNLLDKFKAGRAQVTPEQQQELAAFSAYRADSISNLNQYIKEITGAAMSIPEAERIMRAMPNPGQGVFDGDGPTEFQAKLGAAVRSSQLALARYNYLKKSGFPGTVEEAAKRFPLERMNGVIQERTNAIAREISQQNPGIGLEQLKPVIRQRLRAEFGIDA